MDLAARHGRAQALNAARAQLGALRERIVRQEAVARTELTTQALADAIGRRLALTATPNLRAVFNLTGTVIHTNLGRAPLPAQALDALQVAALEACTLEYDLESGSRGDRDAVVGDLLCELTGAPAATVVNNNAAAVLLALNTLAARREVLISRGELIEIGGSFRMPDIMARAGCKLKEVGTTNRTHLKDFSDAMNERVALTLKVHPSNYSIAGFTAAVEEGELASLAHRHEIPLMVDLGSGALVDLTRWGLPKEPTVRETLERGADLVTFSGDKLLGGPQAGIIVGSCALIERIKRNPLRRALRVDKLTLAALEAVLRLYRDPDSLTLHLPALRLLTRSAPEIRALGERLLPSVRGACAPLAEVSLQPCQSQIGSGAQPLTVLASTALVVRPQRSKGSAVELKRIESAFRALARPVLGRIEKQTLWFDLRCLEDEAGFLAQLGVLRLTA